MECEKGGGGQRCENQRSLVRQGHLGDSARKQLEKLGKE